MAKVKFELSNEHRCKCYHLLNLKKLVNPVDYDGDTFDQFLNDYALDAFAQCLDVDIDYYTELLKGEKNAQKDEG